MGSRARVRSGRVSLGKWHWSPDLATRVRSLFQDVWEQQHARSMASPLELSFSGIYLTPRSSPPTQETFPDPSDHSNHPLNFHVPFFQHLLESQITLTCCHADSTFMLFSITKSCQYQSYLNHVLPFLFALMHFKGKLLSDTIVKKLNK